MNMSALPYGRTYNNKTDICITDYCISSHERTDYKTDICITVYHMKGQTIRLTSALLYIT